MFDASEATFAANKVMRELGKNGQVGYTEYNGGTVSFDGNLSGKETLPGEILDVPGVFVKVCDYYVSAEELKSLTMVAEIYNGEIVNAHTFKKDGLNFEDNEGICIVFEKSGNPLMLSILDDSPEEGLTAGTYVYYGEGENTRGFVSSIEYGSETIHPIDPKYLPGAVLPVVELETAIVGSDTPVALSEAESALLDTVAAMECPISVVLHPVEGASMNVPCLYSASGGATAYWGNVMGSSILLSNQSGAWTGFYGSM